MDLELTTINLYNVTMATDWSLRWMLEELQFCPQRRMLVSTRETQPSPITYKLTEHSLITQRTSSHYQYAQSVHPKVLLLNTKITVKIHN